MKRYKLFEVNQNAVIKNRYGQILILERDGKRMLPGGRLEKNETWLEGLQREVREETGINKFVTGKVLDIKISDSGKTYIIVFLCEIKNAPKIKLSDEHQDFAWVNKKDINKYIFWNGNIKKTLLKI